MAGAGLAVVSLSVRESHSGRGGVCLVGPVTLVQCRVSERERTQAIFTQITPSATLSGPP